MTFKGIRSIEKREIEVNAMDTVSSRFSMRMKLVTEPHALTVD